ncbi:ATP-binding protein [candidate division KSB1 bacterium]|nr:ATP-binding protein [candidate division KSB1 bacterium]
MLKKILFVEKNCKSRETIHKILRGNDYDVFCTNRDNSIESLFKDNMPDLVITDICGERDSGFEILRYVKELHPPVPIILIVQQHYDATILRAIELGVFDLLVEPIREDDLLQTIKRAEYTLQGYRLKSEFSNLVKNLSIKIACASNEFVLDDIQKVFQDTMLNYSKITPDNFLTLWLGVEEALTNALEHGNLELESQWKDELSTGNEFSKFEEMRKIRLTDAKYGARQIALEVQVEDGNLIISVEDEGCGFNDRSIGHGLDHRVYGRGLAIIDNIMDSIEFNEKGNRIIMRKAFPE